MFQLLKLRNFSDYISDTFSFFKETGKHYFTHYFVINGGFLLVLSVLIYFVFKVYFELLFSNIGTVNQDFGALENFFNNNLGLIIGVVATLFILILFVSLLNFSYPILYLKLYEKNKGNSFSTSELLKEMKSNLGRITGYFIKLFLISIPLLLLLGVVMMLLVFIIIGIPLILIVFPAYLAWMNLSLFVYLNSNKGFFDSLGKGFSLLKDNFWPIIGSNLVMLVIIQIVMTVLTMIPYAFGMASVFTSTQNSDLEENPFSFFGIIMAIVFVFSILLNYILNNIQLINNGIIYYSLREDSENNQPHNQIDLIGSNHD